METRLHKCPPIPEGFISIRLSYAPKFESNFGDCTAIEYDISGIAKLFARRVSTMPKL